MHPYAFPKSERLCGQMRIKDLYAGGKKKVVWPLRVTYLPWESTQVLVWAPKSLFRHAVDRTRLRRVMREAWRLQQHELEGKYLLAFNYIDKKEQSYQTIYRAMGKAIEVINAQGKMPTEENRAEDAE